MMHKVQIWILSSALVIPVWIFHGTAEDLLIDAAMSSDGFRLVFDGTNSSYVQISGATSLTETRSPLDIEWSYDEIQTWLDPLFPSNNLPCLYRVRKMNSVEDVDNDGMDDIFELTHGLDPINVADAILDLDGDKLKNLAEYQMGLNVTIQDSDFDGMNDGVELQYPCLDSQEQDADTDPDADGMDSRVELFFNRDPCIADAGSTLTFYVDGVTGNNTNDGSINEPFANIQQGVDVATSQGGGHVIVAPGIYSDVFVNQHGTYSQLRVKDGVYVQGAGIDQTIINNLVVFYETQTGGLQDLTIDAFNQTGMSIYQSGDILLQSIKVVGYHWENVVNNNSKTLFDDVELLSSTGNFGLRIYNTNPVSVLNSTIAGNNLGGIAVNNGVLTLFNSRIVSNGLCGGVKGVNQSNIRIFSSFIQDNISPGVQIWYPMIYFILKILSSQEMTRVSISNKTIQGLRKEDPCICYIVSLSTMLTQGST